MQKRKIPVHEDGNATRYWLDVEDCANAILTVLDNGCDREIYNVGGNTEMSVRDVVGHIVEAFHGPTVDFNAHVEFQYKRQGLDTRYHNEDTKLRALGWTPNGNLVRDLPALVSHERLTFRW